MVLLAYRLVTTSKEHNREAQNDKQDWHDLGVDMLAIAISCLLIHWADPRCATTHLLFNLLSNILSMFCFQNWFKGFFMCCNLTCLWRILRSFWYLGVCLRFSCSMSMLEVWLETLVKNWFILFIVLSNVSAHDIVSPLFKRLRTCTHLCTHVVVFHKVEEGMLVLLCVATGQLLHGLAFKPCFWGKRDMISSRQEMAWLKGDWGTSSAINVMR